jgi:uncharacterized protein YegP (UPF0339 family)
MKGKFEIFRDRKKQWRFRLVASNGKTICQSEGYTRKANCLAGIRSVATTAQGARVVE